MRRRSWAPFATALPICFVLTACRTHTAPKQDDKQAAIDVVLAHERAVQEFDFDKVDSLHTPEARVIEESRPQPLEPGERRDWEVNKDAGLHVAYDPQDATATVQGDVAWVTLTLHSAWTADTPVGQAMLGGSEWHGSWIETFILVRTSAGWKIAFRHTSILPPDFGVEADYQRQHGGMRIAEVAADSPAAKAGLKGGDVLIEYGGRKIDNPVEFERLRYSYYEGENVSVTVLRGDEKITKAVVLQAMR
jgi:PDZ domain/SnoaL-like domain